MLQGATDLIAYLAAHHYLLRDEDGMRSRMTAWRKGLIRKLDRDYLLQPADALILDHVLMDVAIEGFSLGWAAAQRKRGKRKGRRVGRAKNEAGPPGSSLDIKG